MQKTFNREGFCNFGIQSGTVFIYLKLLRESVLFAFHALSVNVLRTVLSLLGITIGIFTIIVVFTIVDALERNVKSSVASLGENVIFVQKWPWAFGSEYPWWKYWQRPLPTFREMEELSERSALAEAMVFQVFLSGRPLNSEGHRWRTQTLLLYHTILTK